MRSDCASSPTRGSRFVGLLSIIMTKVSGSALPEQERLVKIRSAAKIPPKALRAFLRIRNFSQYGGALLAPPPGDGRRLTLSGLIFPQNEPFGLPSPWRPLQFIRGAGVSPNGAHSNVQQ